MAEKLNNMVSIKALKSDNGAVKDFAYDYYNSSMYLCDAIMEHADSSVDIYYSDISKYLAENVEQVQATIDEFSWEGVGQDLYKATQMAQFRELEDELYSQTEEIWKQIAFEYLETFDEYKYSGVPNELIEAIEDWACDFDGNNRIDDMTDNINDWFADHEEEEDEDKEII